MTDENTQAEAAPDMGAAARSEDEPKRVEWRGLTFDLSEKLPGTLLFDLARLEDGESVAAVLGMLRSLLGDDYFAQVRDKIKADAVPFDEVEKVIGDLMDSVLKLYGLGVGESGASQDS